MKGDHLFAFKLLPFPKTGHFGSKRSRTLYFFKALTMLKVVISGGGGCIGDPLFCLEFIDSLHGLAKVIKMNASRDANPSAYRH